MIDQVIDALHADQPQYGFMDAEDQEFFEVAETRGFTKRTNCDKMSHNNQTEREDRKMTNVKEVQERLDKLKARSTAQLIIYARNNFEIELTADMGRDYIFKRVGYLEQGKIAGFNEKTMARLKSLEDPEKIQKVIDEAKNPTSTTKVKKLSFQDKLREVFSQKEKVCRGCMGKGCPKCNETGKTPIRKSRTELAMILRTDERNAQTAISFLGNPKRCGKGEPMKLKFDRKDQVYYKV